MYLQLKKNLTIIQRWSCNVLTIYNYVTAFYSVVLVSCVQPVNWRSCSAVGSWFPPYIEDFKVFVSEKPYYQEHMYLLNFDKNLWSHIAREHTAEITPYGVASSTIWRFSQGFRCNARVSTTARACVVSLSISRDLSRHNPLQSETLVIPMDLKR
jgi:hypothetical protein